MIRFLHAADIHLDSPLLGLERYEGAPVDQFRGATRRALENLVELAIGERVHFLLIAGDLYDGDWDDYNTGLFFVKQMSRLRDAGIPVYMIRGNHDAASRITKSLKLPDNVRMLSHDSVESAVLEDVGVCIHGRGFAQMAELNNLALQYPSARRGYVNIGLLHTSLEGCSGHQPYAPCAVDDLRRTEYDYWALGHIHKRDDTTYTDPPIVFPGNLQGRHMRETGAKGCVLVSLAPGKPPELEFRALDAVRWELCQVSLDAVEVGDDLLAAVGEQVERVLRAHCPLPLAIRVQLNGCCPLHEELVAESGRWCNEVRSLALQHGSDRLWVEKVEFRTLPYRSVTELVSAGGPLAELLQYLDQLEDDEDALRELTAELQDISRKLPACVTEGPDPLDFQNLAYLRRALKQVEPLLVTRLLSKEDTA